MYINSRSPPLNIIRYSPLQHSGHCQRLRGIRLQSIAMLPHFPVPAILACDLTADNAMESPLFKIQKFAPGQCPEEVFHGDLTTEDRFQILRTTYSGFANPTSTIHTASFMTVLTGTSTATLTYYHCLYSCSYGKSILSYTWTSCHGPRHSRSFR